MENVKTKSEPVEPVEKLKYDSGLMNYADRELRIAGMFDKDSDYDGEIGKAVMALVKTFSKQGHSGFSASLTLKIFDKVARWKPLTAIGTSFEEWMEVSDGMWQNKRCFSVFSKDHGKTWYDIDAPKKKWYQFWK